MLNLHPEILSHHIIPKLDNKYPITLVSRFFNDLVMKNTAVIFTSFAPNSRVNGDTLEDMIYIRNLDLRKYCGRSINLQHFTDLTSLNMSVIYLHRSCDNLLGLNLRTLILKSNRYVTDEIVVSMRNLTSLNLKNNDVISGYILKELPNIVHLNLSINHNVKNIDIIHMTQLRSLKLYNNSTITDKSLVCLTNLTCLSTSFSPYYSITRVSITCLTGLTHLDLNNNQCIGDNDLIGLTNLTHLGLVYNKTVSYDALIQLPKLISLDLRENRIVNHSEFTKLTNLRRLRIGGYEVSDNVLNKLTNLVSLRVK
jgi:hypothetical protein